MLSALFRVNDFRSLAMGASNNRLQMIDGLIHNAILNEEYFSIVSIKKDDSICCARTPKCLGHKILSGNFFD
jgi:hypothetical protein